MDKTKITAVILMAAGILGFVYGGFTYADDISEANIRPLTFSIDDKRRVDIPVLASVSLLLLVGGLMFTTGPKKG